MGRFGTVCAKHVWPPKKSFGRGLERGERPLTFALPAEGAERRGRGLERVGPVCAKHVGPAGKKDFRICFGKKEKAPYLCAPPLGGRRGRGRIKRLNSGDRQGWPPKARRQARALKFFE
jgi:hypothetical protein